MMSEKDNFLPSKVCCFCHLSEDNEFKYGKFYEHNGIVTHYYCLLLSSNMEQKGNDDEGILGFLADDIHKELRRGKRLVDTAIDRYNKKVCSYCKKAGATLGCCNIKCKRIFHFPCGLKVGSLHQYFGEFRSYCINHRPKQKVDDYILEEISSSNNVLCCICYDKVNINDFVETLWAPCCKKDAWFHRKCVQQLAMSAGYFFKCPLCNNKEDFQKVMLEFGIYIPSQDASWELVPNAFEELLYRHDQCDATVCICPKGRKHTSSNAKWELVLCQTCGSQGIHMACGHLKWANPIWDCAECASIIRNPKDHDNEESDSSTNDCNESEGSDSDSDDSDTDISVGTDFPMPCTISSASSSSISLHSDIKLRPGPRFFKLQQQIKANSLAKCLPELKYNSYEENITTEVNQKSINKLLKNDDSKKELPTLRDDSLQKTNEKSNSYKECTENKYQQEEIFSSNDKKSQSFQKEQDVIIIESDDDDDAKLNNETIENIDDDDVKIIPLKPRTYSRKTQCQTFKSCTNHIINSSDATENSPSCTTIINVQNTEKTNEQEFTVPKSTIPIRNSNESIALPQLGIVESKKPSDHIFMRSHGEKNTNKINTNMDSMLNIKISNVISLSPDIFAKVSDVKREKNFVSCTNDIDVSPPIKKGLENHLNAPILPPKRSIQKEVYDSADSICKKFKRNDLTITPVNSFDVRRNINIQQRQMSAPVLRNLLGTESDQTLTCKDIKNFSMCTNELSNASLTHNTQKSNVFPQITYTADTYKNINQNYLQRNIAPYTVVRPNNGNLVQLSDTRYSQVYAKFPQNVFLPQSMSQSNCQDTQNNKNVAYVMPNNSSPQDVANNTSLINKQQIVINNQLRITSINGSVNINNNMTESLNKQKASINRGKSHNDTFNSDNSSSNITICDGDAGTSPAASPRIARSYETAINQTDSNSQHRDLSSKKRTEYRNNVEWKISNENGIIAKSWDSNTTSSVFPQVTNNHNICHQSRLIPQHMQLQDLKFQVCGSDSIQMILYDTFFVNVPLEKSVKKVRSNVTVWKPEETKCTSRARGETSCSLNYTDGTSNTDRNTQMSCYSPKYENHLHNDKNKCVTNVVAVVNDNDDLKENFDPASKTLLRNDVLNNISLSNNIDNIVANEHVYNENDDSQRHLISSDINVNRLNDTIYNANTNYAEESVSSISNNYDQDAQDISEWTQCKQSIHNMFALVEERSDAQTFCKETKRTIPHIDFSLNIIKPNKNIQKILQDDVTNSTKRNSNNKDVNNDHTDDSPTLCLKSSSRISKKDDYKCLDNINFNRAKTKNVNMTCISNLAFNEYSISNIHVDAYDSTKFVQWMTCQENTTDCITRSNNKYNVDASFKISIDLCKIQNLIDSKPELFTNFTHSDNKQRYKCASQLHARSGYTPKQVKSDIINSNNLRHGPSNNKLLQSKCTNNVERILVQDTLSVHNARCQRQKYETTYFDKRISNR